MNFKDIWQQYCAEMRTIWEDYRAEMRTIWEEEMNHDLPLYEVIECEVIEVNYGS